MMQRPYAESCEENKQVIFEVIKNVFADAGQLLEIGSGTGQHAVYFSELLPHINWQPSDIKEQIAGIECWMQDVSHDRVQSPVILDVSNESWPFENMDYVFTANTTHIVSWSHVISMFKGIGKVLKSGGRFAQYGPFNYNGKFTSESNARFDQWLKGRDPESGIRNFQDLEQLAADNGLSLCSDHEMPANNRILVWQKS
jgi:ubiquinone/menaquinone biosynthesis C-methylase UbiE